MINKKCNVYTEVQTQEYNYVFMAGDTNDISLRLKDSEGTIVPIASGKVQLRTSSTSPTVVLEKNGEYDVDLGVFSVKFTSTETQSIISDSQDFVIYEYDVELLLQNGDTFTPLQGTIKVKQSITR